MTRLPAVVVSGVVAALLVVASVLLGASPASAHASLVGSDPAEGQRLDGVPGRVSLTFSEDVQEPAFVVVTADGEQVVEGRAQVEANQVSAEVPADAPAGRWTMAYRVVSVDGHPVTGEIAFEVASGAADAAPSESASPTAAPTQDEGAESTQSSSTTGAGGDGAGDGSGLWPPHTEHVVLGVVLLAAAAGVLVWARRRT